VKNNIIYRNYTLCCKAEKIVRNDVLVGTWEHILGGNGENNEPFQLTFEPDTPEYSLLQWY
jgi:hypothetical protein